jgi:hypothetical protein
VLKAIRYYWITARGYRLHPWDSPYLRWRLETYWGAGATHLDARGFCRLVWRERASMSRFLGWVEERRREQRRAAY